MAELWAMKKKKGGADILTNTPLSPDTARRHAQRITAQELLTFAENDFTSPQAP